MSQDRHLAGSPHNHRAWWVVYLVPSTGEQPVVLAIMVTAVTNGIQVSVRCRFEAVHSDVRAGNYVYSYRVTIENGGAVAVRLQRRHWHINDSLAPPQEVEGPGVVGETPVIAPGESYTYSSACNLRSSLGRMEGSYLMERIGDGSFFRVAIPLFLMQHPPTLN
jgi:ApaG protein